MVVVGPHYAGALVARQRSGSHGAEDQWDFAVTHDRSLVVAAGRALLRQVAPDEGKLDTLASTDPARLRSADQRVAARGLTSVAVSSGLTRPSPAASNSRVAAAHRSSTRSHPAALVSS